MAEAATAGATSVSQRCNFEQSDPNRDQTGYVHCDRERNLLVYNPRQVPVGQPNSRVRYASTNDATGTSNDVTAGDEALHRPNRSSPFQEMELPKADATASKEGTGGNAMSIQS